MRLRRLGPCLAAIAMLAPAARAEDGLPRIHAGAGLAGLLSEVRFGATAHDILGKEGGADINGELLFATPVPARLTEGLAPALRWLAEPRPHLGFSINTAGFTSTGYFGLTWTTLLTRDLLRPGDGLRLDLFFGGSVNNGSHASTRPDRSSLGGNLLFRLGGEIGYQITPALSVSVFFEHNSNGGLARLNEALNGLGIRLGLAL